MSIRSEIRAALVDGPKTTDELLPLVASVEGDRKRLGNHMGNLATEQMVRRAGLADDGKPLYQLDPKMWPEKEPTPTEREERPVTGRKTKLSGPISPANESQHEPPKAARKAKAGKKAPPAALKKSQRTAAKVQRKTAVPRTAKTSTIRFLTVKRGPFWRVGLQVDGSVFAFDPDAGTHQVIDAAIVRQILGMAAMLQPTT